MDQKRPFKYQIIKYFKRIETFEVNRFKIRIINGYGAQDDDSMQNFWGALDEEIFSAKSENCLILIQMDANAKVGQKVIPADPNNITDSNGEQLLALASQHGLNILNADAKCRGSITRYPVQKIN